MKMYIEFTKGNIQEFDDVNDFQFEDFLNDPSLERLATFQKHHSNRRYSSYPSITKYPPRRKKN